MKTARFTVFVAHKVNGIWEALKEGSSWLKVKMTYMANVNEWSSSFCTFLARLRLFSEKKWWSTIPIELSKQDKILPLFFVLHADKAIWVINPKLWQSTEVYLLQFFSNAVLFQHITEWNTPGLTSVPRSNRFAVLTQHLTMQNETSRFRARVA